MRGVGGRQQREERGERREESEEEGGLASLLTRVGGKPDPPTPIV